MNPNQTRHPTRRSSLLFLLLLLAMLNVQPVHAQTDALPNSQLENQIRQRLEQFGGNADAGMWIGDAAGNVLFRYQPDRARPTASAIKTAFLIELFASFSNRLDAPPEGIDAILQDTHPAIAHFSAEQRAEIRKQLGSASVRQIGRIMMGSDPAPNVVYNAAANVTTALLGGPEQLTQKIHLRSDQFRNISIRRYMLADRNIQGDNTATPAALAAVLRQLAAGQLKMISPETTQEICSAILNSELRHGVRGQHQFKDGSLSSDPRTRVRAGWFQPEDKTADIVYVVMLEQPIARNPAAPDSSTPDADKQLAELTDELTQLTLKNAQIR